MTYQCLWRVLIKRRSYAKNSDALKMDWCIKALSPSFTARGTYMALGATHYIFFKEIPIGSEYTMEAYCLGWDEKWMFLACEFVIYPKKTSKAEGAKNKVAASVVSSAPHIVPTISAPPTRTASPNSSTPVSGTATPAQGSPLGNKVEEIKRAWLARRKENPRKDGGVTCCLSISEYCFKIDRVTIPPVSRLLYQADVGSNSFSVADISLHFSSIPFQGASRSRRGYPHVQRRWPSFSSRRMEGRVEL